MSVKQLNAITLPGFESIRSQIVSLFTKNKKDVRSAILQNHQKRVEVIKEKALKKSSN